jgi:phosphomannomutase
LALLYILQVLSREQKPLSQIIAPYKKYAHSGEINFEIQDKDATLVAIQEKYAHLAIEIVHIDGLWYRFEWGWVSVRTSNTEPVVRLNLETPTAEMTKEKVEEFSALLKSFE